VPRNLEFKCRIPSLAAAKESARALAAEDHGLLVQEDTYFIVPRGRLKIRVHEGGTVELIWYQRADQNGERWSDYTKIDISNTPGLKEVLAGTLGVRCVIRKRRHLFLTQDARIHLDDVEGLGSFIEFEVTNGDASVAPKVMGQLCEAFGVSLGEGIGGSYADLRLGEAVDRLR
jgi:predicted adenylyl cyclase CyaB